MSSRIACSPLSGRIHIGRVNKDGTAFTSAKRDVTSDVLGAVIGKAEYHGGAFEVRGSNGRSPGCKGGVTWQEGTGHSTVPRPRHDAACVLVQ